MQYFSKIVRVLVLFLVSVVLVIPWIFFSGVDSNYSFFNWRLEYTSVGVELSHGMNSVFLDIRSIEEYRKGHIPGAVSLSRKHWDESLGIFLDLWSPERRVVIYSGEGTSKSSRHVALQIFDSLPDAKILMIKGAAEMDKTGKYN
jgi:rhodanese-related sulfurtransferase